MSEKKMIKYLSTSSIFWNDKEEICILDMDTWLFCKWNILNNKYDIISRVIPKGRYGDSHKLGIVVATIETNNNYYVVFRNTLQVVCVDKNTGVYERFGNNFDVFELTEFVCENTVLVGNKIYLLPRNIRDNIWSFDVVNKTYTRGKTIASIIGNNWIDEAACISNYLVDGNLVSFCVCDTEFVYIIDFYEKRINLIDNPHKYVFEEIAGNKNKKIYIGKNRKSFYAEDDDGINMVSEYNNFDEIITMNYLNHFFYLYIKSGQILKCDEKTKEITTIKYPEFFSCVNSVREVNYIPFFNIVFHNDKLYCIPFSSNGMIVIDKDGKQNFYELTIDNHDVSAERIRSNEIKLIHENEETDLYAFIKYLM